LIENYRNKETPEYQKFNYRQQMENIHTALGRALREKP